MTHFQQVWGGQQGKHGAWKDGDLYPAFGMVGTQPSQTLYPQAVFAKSLFKTNGWEAEWFRVLAEQHMRRGLTSQRQGRKGL